MATLIKHGDGIHYICAIPECQKKIKQIYLVKGEKKDMWVCKECYYKSKSLAKREEPIE